jgi:hypothetical protein
MRTYAYIFNKWAFSLLFFLLKFLIFSIIFVAKISQLIKMSKCSSILIHIHCLICFDLTLKIYSKFTFKVSLYSGLLKVYYFKIID